MAADLEPSSLPVGYDFFRRPSGDLDFENKRLSFLETRCPFAPIFLLVPVEVTSSL